MIKRQIVEGKAFKHEEVSEQILENIKNGNLSPGSKLPSTRQIAKEMGCNFMTVYRAFEKLEEMGVIEKRPRSGTYIKQRAINFINDENIQVNQSDKDIDKIGILIIPGKSGNYLNAILSALDIIAEEKDISLNLRTVSKYDRNNILKIKELMSQGCRSIILPALPIDQDMSEIHYLVNTSLVPIVLPQLVSGLENNTHAKPRLPNSPMITHTTLACEYFQSLGYTNIALIGTDSQVPDDPFQKMVMDYTKFINKNRLQSYIGLVDQRQQLSFDNIIDTWKHLAGDLAVVCYFDEIAIKFMNSAQKLGLRVPEDIAVLGYNNIPDAEFSDPPLSTIQCPHELIAEKMILHALKMCGDESRAKTREWEENFIIRESCGAKLKAEAV